MRPVPSPSDDVFVVRTPRGWNLTPMHRSEADPIDDAALHALVRANGGAKVAADDPAAAPPRSMTSRRGPGHWVALRSESGLAPLPAFVARMSVGGLLVEGRDGEQLVLDEVDMTLIEAVTADRTVGEVLDDARAALGPAAPLDDEMGGRLRRLADLGRLLLDDDSPPEPAPPEPPGADEPEPLPEPEPERATRAPAFELHRVVSAGRRYLERGRRRLRLEHDGHGVAPMDGVPPALVGPEAPAEPVSAEQPIVEPPTLGDEASGRVVYLDSPVVGPVARGAVPVYAVFHVATGPPLSLGMLTACTRRYHDGALNECFEIRRAEHPESCFADLAQRPGPAVLLLSHYVWSFAHNMEVARRAKELNPRLVVIHGGPSTPKYPGDCEAFFTTYGDLVDVAVRGEGEVTLAEALLALAGSAPELDLSRLASVDGLTFRCPSDGAIVRTDDRERVADLDILPSPYLTGEFDHLDPSAWVEVTLETSRGCPYGCTFCDWGSSTLSRIRKFDIERVAGEMDWAGRRRFASWAMGDANFGIVSRDVDVAQRIAEVKARWGYPEFLGFNVAKNTTKHLTAIVDELVQAGVGPVFSLALQTRDEDTLEAVHRTNISTDHYTSLASSMRRRGLPLQADIMLGLPGQTVDSLSDDLQFLADHEIPARMWITHLLPNAPINDAAYREEWAVEANEAGVVISTKSFTAEDRAEMIRIRHAYTIFEQFGLLRHVSRFVQWDHGVGIITILRRIVSVSDEAPEHYPLLNWSMRYFDYFSVPPLGWRSFYDEVRRFLVTEFAVPPTPALDSMLDLQAFLMPEIGRTFPATITLRHDYPAYFRERTRGLWSGQPAATSGTPLPEYGPGLFTVYGDPLARCSPAAIKVINDPRNEAMTDDFWMAGHWELDSSLVVNQAEVAATRGFIGLLEQVPDDLPDEPEPYRAASPVRISGPARPRGSGGAPVPPPR